MLDRLCGGDQRGVEHGLVLDLAGDFAGFFQDTVDGRALGALRHRLDHFEHPVEALDVAVGLFEVHPEALLQLGVGGLRDHVGQRFFDLVLGVIDVLQRMHEQLVESVDVG